jgi:pilus assembly protein Flp/PilA
MSVVVWQRQYYFVIHLKRNHHMVRKCQSEKGQGLLEYALILVLVALIVIIVLQILGPEIGNVFSQIISMLDITELVG